ncbi:MAG: TolC family protein [Pseudomonadota bacterium]
MVLRLLTFASLALSLGCGHQPPSTAERLGAEAVLPEWSRSLDAAVEVPNLWHLVADPEVTGLVSAALAGNPNLAQTALRVSEAEAALRRQSGAVLPAASLQTSSRTSSSDGAGLDTETFVASLAWEADLWGRLRSQARAGAERLYASEADYRAAQNSLAATVIRTLLELAYSEEIIGVEQRRIDTLRLNETLIRERYLVGIGSLADLEAARTSAARARAGLLERQERYTRLSRSLRVILGDYDADPQVPDVFAVTVPAAPVPLSVMSARPDVASAMARANAAAADADAAGKALLPTVSLSLDQTRSSASLGDVLSADGLTVLLLNITAPVFQGGQLRAERDRAEFAAEREFWVLREALLNALREVEDSMNLEQSLQLQTHERELALRFARNNRTLFESRYQEGLANIFDLLNAQQTAFDAEVQLLSARLLQNQNRVDLGVALGLSL